MSSLRLRKWGGGYDKQSSRQVLTIPWELTLAGGSYARLVWSFQEACRQRWHSSWAYFYTKHRNCFHALSLSRIPLIESQPIFSNYTLSKLSAKFPPHLPPLILSSLFPPPPSQTMMVLRFVNLSQSSSLAVAMLTIECVADRMFALQLATVGMGPWIGAVILSCLSTPTLRDRVRDKVGESVIVCKVCVLTFIRDKVRGRVHVYGKQATARYMHTQYHLHVHIHPLTYPADTHKHTHIHTPTTC